MVNNQSSNNSIFFMKAKARTTQTQKYNYAASQELYQEAYVLSLWDQNPKIH